MFSETALGVTTKATWVVEAEKYEEHIQNIKHWNNQRDGLRKYENCLQK